MLIEIQIFNRKNYGLKKKAKLISLCLSLLWGLIEGSSMRGRSLQECYLTLSDLESYEICHRLLPLRVEL